MESVKFKVEVVYRPFRPMNAQWDIISWKRNGIKTVEEYKCAYLKLLFQGDALFLHDRSSYKTRAEKSASFFYFVILWFYVMKYESTLCRISQPSQNWHRQNGTAQAPKSMEVDTNQSLCGIFYVLWYSCIHVVWIRIWPLPSGASKNTPKFNLVHFCLKWFPIFCKFKNLAARDVLCSHQHTKAWRHHVHIWWMEYWETEIWKSRIVEWLVQFNSGVEPLSAWLHIWFLRFRVQK